MKISVIICAYNAEKTLEECLQSILNQTFTDFEIVLIDDGSTDRTAQIAQETLKGKVKCQIISQENKGVSYARNVGIQAAQAPIITFVDSDDAIEKNCLELLYNLMEKTDSDMSCCILDNHSNITETCVLSGSEALTDLIPGYHIQGYTCGKLFKKELFEEVSFPVGKNVCEDTAVMHHLVEKSRRVVITPEALYNYIRRGNSLSSSSSAAVVKSTFFIRMERYQYYKDRQKIFSLQQWRVIVQYIQKELVTHSLSFLSFKSLETKDAYRLLQIFYHNENQFLSRKERQKMRILLFFFRFSSLRYLLVLFRKSGGVRLAKSLLRHLIIKSLLRRFKLSL